MQSYQVVGQVQGHSSTFFKIVVKARSYGEISVDNASVKAPKDRIFYLIELLCAGNQAKFSRDTALAPTTVSDWVSGARVPYSNTLEKVSGTYGYNHRELVDWVLKGKGDPPKPKHAKTSGSSVHSGRSHPLLAGEASTRDTNEGGPMDVTAALELLKEEVGEARMWLRHYKREWESARRELADVQSELDRYRPQRASKPPTKNGDNKT